jgi:hypothetical protein
MTVRARRLPRRLIALSATVGLVGGLAIALPQSASAAANATIAVTSAADGGPGSLRQAIIVIDANAAPGADVIAFDLGEQPGAVSVITWTSLAARGRRCPRSPIL